MKGLILLDRDGVINKMVIDPEHGTIDSPLHPSQVTIFPWVVEALLRLQKASYALAIVTNQPSSAKGKTTRKNLEDVQALILETLTQAGVKILDAQVCFHRSEDRCECRKPKPGMLNTVFERHPEFVRGDAWMIGDGVTDVEAGLAAGVKTAFIGPRKTDAIAIFEEKGLNPDLWVDNLLKFALLLAP